jgi:hypothetical protein
MYLFESKSNRARCHPERSEGSCFFVQLEDPSSRAPQDDSAWSLFNTHVFTD